MEESVFRGVRVSQFPILVRYGRQSTRQGSRGAVVDGNEVVVNHPSDLREGFAFEVLATRVRT